MLSLLPTRIAHGVAWTACLFGLVWFSTADAANPTSANAWSLTDDATQFLQDHCLDCHDGPDGEAGFDVHAVGTDLTSPRAMQQWIQIHDRVSAGEMPPPEYEELDADELSKWTSPLRQHLVSYQRDEQRRLGRVRGRRLSNQQLSRTLQDLLLVHVPLEDLMPPEQRVGGYAHLVSAQSMSHFQLKTHLKVVDAALDNAFAKALEPSSDWSINLAPEKIANKPKGRRNREPEMREGLAVVWSSNMIFYGRIASTTVPEDGWYEITLTASSVKPPKEHGVWCSVRSGECNSGAPLMSWIGGFEAEADPKTMTYQAWLPKGHRLEVRPADKTLKQGRFQGGQVGFGEGEPQDLPGVAMHSLQMKRIYPAGERRQTRDRLLGNLPLRYNRSSKQSEIDVDELVAKRIRQIEKSDPKATLPEGDEATQTILRQALRTNLHRFAQLAFRRPVERSSIKSIVELADSELDNGATFVDALRAGYRAILCSPRFLYLTERSDASGKLDDWSIASRLSYFLTGSMPDDELRMAAKRGQLQDATQLKHQTDRLLQTPRGQQFVVDLADQWLDLVDIDFTEPDRRLFRDFDTTVQAGMLKETHLFLQHLLDQNRPIHELVSADYTFLNTRLARYYELTPTEADIADLGDQSRLVKMDPSIPRGGILTHGAILKVTANGNDTSPVLRGIWVSERILGTEIPSPPENVPAVEPDIRGATTIRDLLAKHQADPSCASCHRNIDPPGFALENFDAGGRWRDRYMQKRGNNYKRGPAIDPSFEMPDGSKFDSFVEFRDLIRNREETLAKNVASHLLTYGTGQTIQFADRERVDQIVANTRQDSFGFRSLLDEVIQSDVFLSK
ncbi:DUF1592 domain-containing protein [Rhodopirellula halodulae]|uniref:DUF1592 domain-containing protein n=1 Tax=Rhodopirellula halodulae TaxID=2894198 RepID=UPI001E3D7DBA|nr:DUF1592 domain-containing protein [Rhodopirellula sp. JC737]MCC9657695.1 DUF1592 domain-containing protein [Rhodopirellula sp. JC737]